MNALIVESSCLLQRELAMIYEELEFETDVVSTGMEALERFSRRPYDTVCIPYYPKDSELRDYRDLVSELRKLEGGEKASIVLVTGNKGTVELSECFHYGITEVFKKDSTRFRDLRRYLCGLKKYYSSIQSIKGTVLLITEDQVLVSGIKKYFHGSHVTFMNLSDPEEAESIAQAAEFDLIITSAGILGFHSNSYDPTGCCNRTSEQLSGMSLVRKIRILNERLNRVPVLAISKSDNLTQRLSIYQTGANDFLQLPFSMEELAVRVKNLIENKKFVDKIEEQKKLLEDQKHQLYEQSIHDQLTGLYNRHFYNDYISKNLDLMSRRRLPLSMLVVDLDHFKKINDTHGHSTGDVVLRAISGVLKNTFREHDSAFRFGGEEFVIVLPCCSGKDAQNRAQYLLQLIRRLKPAGLQVTASIGVSSIPAGMSCDCEHLFKTADEAVYEAKNTGRNRVVFRSIAAEVLHEIAYSRNRSN